MKKRVLSALLALCMAGSLAGTVWAAEPGQATPETAQAAEAPQPAAETVQPDADADAPQETAYTAEAEKDGQPLKVTVTAPQDAFGETKPASQAALIEDESALDAVAATLDGAGVEYDGFAALDVKFVDGTGAEVEPEKAVKVRFELPETLLAEDADLSTLTIHHLVEDADGNVTTVEPVASVADGDIEVSDALAAAANEAAGIAPLALDAEETSPAEDGPEIFDDTAPAEEPALVAEFEVDGFSTFTITWKSGNSTYFTVTVHYVDENRNEISGSQKEDVSISKGNNIDFTTYAKSIEGYAYQGAYLESIDGAPVTKVTATESKKTRTLTFYNGDSTVGLDSVDNVSDQTINHHVYLVYKNNSSTPDDGETKNATVTTGKTAVIRDDGNYDLTLTISGDRGSSTSKQQVDILFILDESGSMDSWEGTGENEKQRIDLLKTAASNLVTTISTNTNIDARYSAVSFSASQNRDFTDWTDAAGVNSFINALDPDEGTNYQQGIYDGKALLNKKRANAITFVIFVSDGIPTYRGINVRNYGNDSTNGNGYNDNANSNINAAVNEIKTMSCDYFYAIGMGSDFGQDNSGRDKQGTTNLKSLASNVNATYKGDSNVFSASDTETLQSAFKQITGNITFFAAKNVTVTDQLSQYADIVLNASSAAEFTIKVIREAVTDSDGTTSAARTWVTDQPVPSGGTFTFQNRSGTNVKVTASYSTSTKTITLDFPDDYELEQGYTYSISTVITPSTAAVSADKTGTDATRTPDRSTGTHAEANQTGFYSNEEAKVTYTANGAKGSQLFPKPVIQVQNGSLTIEKTFSGLPEDKINSLRDSLTFTVTDSSTPAQPKGTYKLNQFTKSNDGTYSYTVSNLPAGSYTVTESNGDVSGYTWTTVDADKAKTTTVQAGGTVTASFTNSYTRTMHTLKVTKQIKGNMASTAEDFQFTVSWTGDNSVISLSGEKLPKSETSSSDFTESPVTIKNNGTFALKATESIELSVPEGLVVTIDEDNGNYTVAITGATVSETDNSVCTVTVDEDKNVTYTNTLNITTPPTGLNRNGTPFGVLMAAALVAGVALAGSVVNRRLRRRREE